MEVLCNVSLLYLERERGRDESKILWIVSIQIPTGHKTVALNAFDTFVKS